MKEHFKIKLIFPCRFEVNDPYCDEPMYYLPYGMGVLVSYIKKQGMYVEQDDLSIKFNAERKWLKKARSADLHIRNYYRDISGFFKTNELSCRLEKIICRMLSCTSIKGFDIIGFSIHTYGHFLVAILLSSQIKKYTNTPIVFGGPFITLYGQLYPCAFEFIDFMIMGEGEIPLIQLVHSLFQKTSPEQIPGLIFKRRGTLVVVPREKYPIEDMCMPDFEGMPLELYKSKDPDKKLWLPYQVSRGCNGVCSYCEHKGIDSSLEYKSYRKTVVELQQLKEKYNSRLFRFCDSSINSSYEYLDGLCKEFIGHKMNIYWKTYARIECLDKALLQKMRLAGCERLCIGVESGSDRILRLMRKRFTSMQAQTVLRDAAELGIQNICFFISGYPYERKEDIRNTVDIIRRNKKYICFAHVYAFYLPYGCDMWKHPEIYGITNLTQLVPKPYFSFDEIDGLRWPKKRAQQVSSQKQVKRAIRKYLIIDRLLQKFIST